MNRIDQRFGALKALRKKALVAYITAGDPDLNSTTKLVRAFEAVHVDVLELGVPFSDPLADGVVNQLAADRALKSGTNLGGILKMIRSLRKGGCRIPLVLFTYFNPIHQYGQKRFIRDASQAGVDGILNLDLPPEESVEWDKMMVQAGIHPIYLIAPTTDEKRIARIVPGARGFIYYVSREGVTGMQNSVATGLSSRLAMIRKRTRVPVVVGFGISTPAQVKAASVPADGCVVGSAIVHRIGKLGKSGKLVPEMKKFVSSLVRPLHGVIAVKKSI